MSFEPMHARVLSRRFLTPSMIRVVLGGDELVHFESTSVPDEFLWLSFSKRDGGSGGRYYTVRQWDVRARHLTIDFVKHEEGVATEWAQGTIEGDTIEIYQPRSRFDLPASGSTFLLGDFSALPAIGRIIEDVPHDRHVVAHVEIPAASDRQSLPVRNTVDLTWHETSRGPDSHTRLAAIARSVTLPEDLGYIWIAGEASAVSECRRYFRDVCGIAKDRITSVGYWIEGRARG